MERSFPLRATVQYEWWWAPVAAASLHTVTGILQRVDKELLLPCAFRSGRLIPLSRIQSRD